MLCPFEPQNLMHTGLILYRVYTRVCGTRSATQLLRQCNLYTHYNNIGIQKTLTQFEYSESKV